MSDGMETRCRICGGVMVAGEAIAQTWTGGPDMPGGDVRTLSPGGPGRLVRVLKCSACGHSIVPPQGAAGPAGPSGPAGGGT